MLFRLFSAIVTLVAVAGHTLAQESPKTLPKPDDKPGAANKPVQVTSDGLNDGKLSKEIDHDSY